MSIIKAGVIGYPVSHSLSPKLHGYWLKHYQIAGTYEPIEIAPDELQSRIHQLIAQGYAGFNVTLPHKEAMLSLVDDISDIASRIGAINTVKILPDGTLYGTNSDAYGFMQHLKQSVGDLSLYKDKAVVLGAGGAARAICAALQDEGWKQIFLINRTKDKAEQIAQDLGAPIIVVDWAVRDEALQGAGLLVNTTSLGMQGKEPLSISLQQLPLSALVYDIVYRPLMTELLKQAQLRGNTIITGLGMLLHQAVMGFEMWFGTTPTPDKALEQWMITQAL